MICAGPLGSVSMERIISIGFGLVFLTCRWCVVGRRDDKAIETDAVT